MGINVRSNFLAMTAFHFPMISSNMGTKAVDSRGETGRNKSGSGFFGLFPFVHKNGQN